MTSPSLFPAQELEATFGTWEQEQLLLEGRQCCCCTISFVADDGSNLFNLLDDAEDNEQAANMPEKKRLWKSYTRYIYYSGDLHNIDFEMKIKRILKSEFYEATICLMTFKNSFISFQLCAILFCYVFGQTGKYTDY